MRTRDSAIDKFGTSSALAWVATGSRARVRFTLRGLVPEAYAHCAP
jgi:hypothetical protein